MDDRQVLSRINELVAEEDQLRATPEHVLTSDERARVAQIEVALDQCWDLLRQRRARREFDQDPDDATVRDTDTVEHYRQ